MALTDLSWEILASKLPTGAITVSNSKVLIDVGLVNNSTIDALTDQGVVKFFSMLFTAANKAQAEVNNELADGEKLTTFSPATIGTNSNGYITLSRPFVCRAELSTATNIISTNG